MDDKILDQYSGSEIYFSINGLKSKTVRLSKDEQPYWSDEIAM